MPVSFAAENREAVSRRWPLCPARSGRGWRIERPRDRSRVSQALKRPAFEGRSTSIGAAPPLRIPGERIAQAMEQHRCSIFGLQYQADKSSSVIAERSLRVAFRPSSLARPFGLARSSFLIAPRRSRCAPDAPILQSGDLGGGVGSGARGAAAVGESSAVEGEHALQGLQREGLLAQSGDARLHPLERIPRPAAADQGGGSVGQPAFAPGRESFLLGWPGRGGIRPAAGRRRDGSPGATRRPRRSRHRRANRAARPRRTDRGFGER